MKPTQMLAWLICLALAFFAGAIGIKATYRVAMLEKQFGAVREAAEVQSAAIDRLSDVLDRLDARMEFIALSQAARAQLRDGAGDAGPDPAADRAVE